MRENCTYGLMRGNRTIVLRTVPNGHEVGNDRYSQELNLNERATKCVLFLYSTHFLVLRIKHTNQITKALRN